MATSAMSLGEVEVLENYLLCHGINPIESKKP
jgi:hypothetical protein